MDSNQPELKSRFQSFIMGSFNKHSSGPRPAPALSQLQKNDSLLNALKTPEKQLITSPLNPASATFKPGRAEHPLWGGVVSEQRKTPSPGVPDLPAPREAAHQKTPGPTARTVKVHPMPLPTPSMAIPALCYFAHDGYIYCRLPGNASPLPMVPYRPPQKFRPPDRARQTPSIPPGFEALFAQRQQERQKHMDAATHRGPPLNAPTEPAAMRKKAKISDQRGLDSSATSASAPVSSVDASHTTVQPKASQPGQRRKMEPTTTPEAVSLAAGEGVSHSQSRVWISENVRLAKGRQKTELSFRRIGAEGSPACPRSNSEYLELAKFSQQYETNKLRKEIMKSQKNKTVTGQAEEVIKTPEPSSPYLPTLTDIDTTVNDAVKDSAVAFDEHLAMMQSRPLLLIDGKKFTDGRSPMFFEDLCWNNDNVEKIPEDLRVSWPTRAELSEHVSARYRLGEDRSLPYPRQNRIADKFDPTQAVYDDDGRLNIQYRKIMRERLDLDFATDGFDAARQSYTDEEESIDKSELCGPMQSLLQSIRDADPFDTMPKNEKN